MARMHSGSKGKSKSYKPVERKVGDWMTYKPKEIEAIIVKLAKLGQPASQIGLHLRDQYGIPDVKTVLKKSITQVMQDKDILPEIPEDVMALLKKEVFLNKHIEKNPKDETARRGLILAQSKTKRLIKHYRVSGRLPVDWKYDPKQIALLVE